jgi:hypothetical protein
MSKEESLRRVKSFRTSEAQKVLREYLLLKTEDWKEALITASNNKADELRGAILQVRGVLKEIETDIPDRGRTNPY